MLSCKEAAQLVSRSLDEPIDLRQRLALRFHLLMCRFCSRYERQARFIRKAMRILARQEDESPSHPCDLSLSPEARERIKQSVDKHRDSK